ncbi:uncharacterized protein [Lepeophtheirus salmonis]|uniref:uncharacterized protein n=1 Tax=Lepeophtheirus salmonis TaxID=72036 RepID=UPI001AE8A63F|nr:uncharacterized protein LOC121114549 isoform X1 [Lepeophtheirus salmonis]
MNNCYKKKKSLRSRRVIPISELKLFRLDSLRCNSLERSGNLKKNYDCGSFKDLMDHITLVFHELEGTYLQMKEFQREDFVAKSRVSMEDFFFILSYYNHSIVNFDVEKNTLLFFEQSADSTLSYSKSSGSIHRNPRDSSRVFSGSPSSRRLSRS